MPDRPGGVMRSLVERLTAHPPTTLHSSGRQLPFGEDFLRRFLSNLPGMAYRCRNDADWTMEFASPGCRGLTGFEAADLVENRLVSFASLIHPDDRARVREQVRRAVSATAPFQVMYRIRRVDGTVRVVLEHGWGVVGASGKFDAIEGFVTDITDHIGLSEDVGDAEPDGPGALELAHDLNNSLAVIQATAELLMLDHPDNEDLSRDLQDILSAVEKGVALIRQLSSSAQTPHDASDARDDGV